MAMSFTGKQGKVPEWVQITVQKSKLGFNRVHDELKRLYDERVRKSTAVGSDTNQTFIAVVSKRNRVVYKLSRIIGNVKGSLSKFKSGRQFHHYNSDPTRSPDSKDCFVVRKNESPRRKLSTESNHSSIMPHAELIKSKVYTNDRVLHEWDDDVNNDLKNESFEVYAEIDDDTNSINDSESLFPSEFDLKSTKQNHEISGYCASNKNVISGVDKHHISTSGEEEHKYCALHRNRQCVSTYVDMEERDVDSHTKRLAIPPPDKKKMTKQSCSLKRWSKSRKAHYKQLSRSLPTQLIHGSEDMDESCSELKTSDPSIRSGPMNDESLGRESSTICRYESNEWKVTNLSKTLVSCQTLAVKQEKQKNDRPDIDRSFFDYTVEEVVDCFKKCAFVGLAQICLNEQLDGEYFRDVTADDLVVEPFNMNWFHISKFFKVINGWRPKKCRRPEK